MPGSRRSSRVLDEALKRRTVAVIPGFQGVSDDGRVATLGPRRVGHVGGGHRGGGQGRPLRHLHRRRRRLHHRPAHRAQGAQARPWSPSRRCSSWPASAPRCCRSARSGWRCAKHAVAGAVGVRGQARHDDRRRKWKEGHGTQRHRRHRRTTATRRGSPWTDLPDRPGTVAAVIGPLAEAASRST